MTVKEVEEELNGYWPEFMPILHEILLEHGHLMVVHDAYVIDQTQFNKLFFFPFWACGLSTMWLTCIHGLFVGFSSETIGLSRTKGYDTG